MGNSPAWNPDPSTLKPLPVAKGWDPDPGTLKPLPTERAMQQTMGGPPMFVDVPKGAGAAFEQAGQKGYREGGIAGAGLVAGAGTAAVAAPAAIAAAGTLGELAEAHPVAAFVIKKLAEGGLLRAGWQAINLIRKAAE